MSSYHTTNHITRHSQSSTNKHINHQPPTGKALACSTSVGTRVWSLNDGGMDTFDTLNGKKSKGTKGGGNQPLSVRKLDLPVSLAQEFSQALAFSVDGRRLAAYCPMSSTTGARVGSSGQSTRAILKGSLVLLSLVNTSSTKYDQPNDEEDEEEEEEDEEEEGNNRKKRHRMSQQKKQAAKRAKRHEKSTSSSSSSSSSDSELTVNVWHTFDHALNVRHTNGGNRTGARASRNSNASGNNHASRGDGTVEYSDDGLEYVVTSMVFSPDGLWCVRYFVSCPILLLFHSQHSFLSYPFCEHLIHLLICFLSIFLIVVTQSSQYIHPCIHRCIYKQAGRHGCKSCCVCLRFGSATFALAIATRTCSHHLFGISSTKYCILGRRTSE